MSDGHEDCVVCLYYERDSRGLSLVPDPKLEKINDILVKAKERCNYGEGQFKALYEYMESLESLNDLKYHNHCRKKVVHKGLVSRAKRKSTESSATTTKKRGRPSKNDTSVTRVSRSSTSNTFKEKICVFASSGFCKWNKEQIYKVVSDERGQLLLDIKEKTTSDKVRTSLALLTEKGTARCYELHYHQNCLRDAERTCKHPSSKSGNKDTVIRKLADVELLSFVRSDLALGEIVTMKDLNKDYVYLLEEQGLADVGDNYKKHIKALISGNIENISFVRPLQRNESEKVVSTVIVEDAFDDYINWESELMRISKILRRELLENHGKWKFSGSLTTHSFDTPMLKVFFRQLIFGPQGMSRGGKRDAEVNQTVDVMIQLLLGNVKTDRQVKYKPKTNRGYRRTVATPFSLGLSLLYHSKTRSKMLIDDLADMTLGETYKTTINVEKLIESAVIERMKSSGGYCLPSFVKKGVQPYFAIDNVDKNTDTAYGQNTFHGTIIVINQAKNDSAEPLFGELNITEKIENSRIEVLYCEEPIVKPICPKFVEYFTSIDNILNEYICYDTAWALANYYSNVIGPTESQNDSVDEPMEVRTEARIESNSNILNIASKIRSRSTNTKSNVMPTWAATNSLLLSKLKLEKTNSEVVAPILRRPPTDHASLYTALKLTQDISAVIVGPSRKTIITLDMDLFQRALKIKFSVDNENWILRPGELHICFAALHALGKYIDGSGLGSLAIEANIYSPSTLRQVYGGKAFKRGVEHHVINLLSIYYLQFDAVIADDSASDELRIKSIKLRDSLHRRDENINDIFDEIKEYCTNKLACASNDRSLTGLAKYLMSYVQQVESLLCIIRACRQSNFTEFLSALDKQCKYFFAHDLYNYARLIPVHLAMMTDIKSKDPETWQLLSNETFGVNKSSVPFTTLFVDQNLEQKIKDIKGVGGISGITQQDDTLNRFFLTAPYITRMVNRFIGKYCNDKKSERTEHYQLHGNMAYRISKNAAELKRRLEIHCEGNPFAVPMPMKNIISSMLIPLNVLPDILDRDKKGETTYNHFVVTRLMEGSTTGIWDTMKKLKLKTCSTWMSKTIIKHGDKVIKLREERQLFAQFLIIHQARPQLMPNLPQTIGEYEMAITPRSLFTSDGNLLVPKDKNAFMHAIENLVCSRDIVEHSEHSEMGIGNDMSELDASGLGELNVDDSKKAIILDGMAIVQSMKKNPSMKKMINFAEQFGKRVKRLIKGYSEGRVLFDQYVENSLKANTRKARGDINSKASYQIHNDMNITAIPFKELFASSKTKSQLTEYLSLYLIKTFSSGDQNLVVTYGNKVLTTKPDLTAFVEHSHEEADTQIPLHVLDVVRGKSINVVDVWSPDTDILLLLIDLAASTMEVESCNLNLLTGKGDKHRRIDIQEKVKTLGKEKSRAIIGLHNFSGADWGGKFAGIGKQTWIKSFLTLDDLDPIIKSLRLLGEVRFTGNPTSIPSAYLPLEKFLCTVYSPKTKIHTVKGLRWELFRNSNMEGERLPPTVGSFIPHLKRVSYTSMRDKSYRSVTPSLPPIEENGWDIVDGVYTPVKSLLPPAPSAVLELVKCGCKGRCDSEKKQCSCVKNGLSCTPLCKCIDCLNSTDYNLTEEDGGDEETV